MDEFENRIKILQELNYLDSNKIPLIKARVGRELGSADIFLAEVLMENILDNLEPEMVAALLSVYQYKSLYLSLELRLPD
jgi:superfamily II RNA helicase